MVKLCQEAILWNHAIFLGATVRLQIQGILPGVLQFARREDRQNPCWHHISCHSGKRGRMGIWQQFPVLWSIFIMVAQVVQLLRPLFPYAKRIAAFHYFIPALRRLTWDIEMAWYRLELEGHDAVDTLALIDSFRKRYLDLDLQYLGAERLPDLQRIEKGLPPLPITT